MLPFTNMSLQQKYLVDPYNMYLMILTTILLKRNAEVMIWLFINDVTFGLLNGPQITFGRVLDEKKGDQHIKGGPA